MSLSLCSFPQVEAVEALSSKALACPGPQSWRREGGREVGAGWEEGQREDEGRRDRGMGEIPWGDGRDEWEDGGREGMDGGRSGYMDG